MPHTSHGHPLHEGFLLGVIWHKSASGVVLWCQLDPECPWTHGRLTADSAVLTLAELVREANAHAVSHEQPEPAGEPS